MALFSSGQPAGPAQIGPGSAGVPIGPAGNANLGSLRSLSRGPGGLRGQQLASGVRFVRMVQEGQYDLVVANPPYQGTAKMADSSYIEAHYALGKADLYAAFLLRGLELAKEGGVSAMLTMRSWMFIKQYAGLRAGLLGQHGLVGLGDFDRGAFEGIPDEVVSVTVAIFAKGATTHKAHALCPTDRADNARDADRTGRKRAATLCHEGHHRFDPAALKVVPEWPLVYWWDAELLAEYNNTPLLGSTFVIRQGLATSDNIRRIRMPYEVQRSNVCLAYKQSQSDFESIWVPHIMGASGNLWFDSLRSILNWGRHGLALKLFHETRYASYTKRIPSESVYFSRGVAFSTIGSGFSGRVHTYPGTIDTTGCSVYPPDRAHLVCLFNSSKAAMILNSLNPTIHYTNGDVNRLPLFKIDDADAIFAQVESAFGAHEAHREPSIEFRRPGPSPWRHAQAWAQLAVDRPPNTPLPAYAEQLDPEPPTDHLSFALGLALGRFGAQNTPAEGILDPATADLSGALPHGLLFLDRSLPPEDLGDGLGHRFDVAIGGVIEDKNLGHGEALR
jgi:hypothetical protein